MDAETPTRIIKIKFAPRKMPCSKCGAFARRKRIRNRKVRSLAFKETLWLDVHYGEYIAKCGAFSEVVFAITDWSPERRFLGPFRDTFSD